MRRELLPLFGIAALFGSLTTLSVVLAVDPIDYPYEVHTAPRNDKALIYTPPAQYQAATNCSEKCSHCLANDWSSRGDPINRSLPLHNSMPLRCDRYRRRRYLRQFQLPPAGCR